MWLVVSAPERTVGGKANRSITITGGVPVHVHVDDHGGGHDHDDGHGHDPGSWRSDSIG
jgi:hypothetical protein